MLIPSLTTKTKKKRSNTTLGLANTSYPPFDMYYAKLLKQLLEKHEKIKQRTRQITWAKEIFKLRCSVANPIDKERIAETLNWYKQHINDNEMIPQIFSVADFQRKFERIERVMIISKKNEAVKATPEAIKIVKNLSYLQWPKDSQRQLPDTVQRSLNNYADYLKKHQQYCTKKTTFQTKIDEKTFYWASKKLQQELLNNITFIRQWFEAVFSNVINWDEWSGNMKASIFSLKHKEFEKFLIQKARAYGNEYYAVNYLKQLKNLK